MKKKDKIKKAYFAVLSQICAIHQGRGDLEDLPYLRDRKDELKQEAQQLEASNKIS